MTVDQVVVVDENEIPDGNHLPQTQSAAVKPIRKTYKILVVDDYGSARVLLATFIDFYYQDPVSENTARVLQFNNASSVLSEIRSLTGAVLGPVDLIFTDLNMPNCSGYSFLELLRADASGLYSKTPVVVTTGDLSDNVDFGRLEAAGVKREQILFKSRFGYSEVEKVLAEYCAR
ncbi:TPA: response regulator [Candidatus Woesearchaeota archaeon]|nr:response regulator [Candidatus Woesearchaeota archaeon]